MPQEEVVGLANQRRSGERTRGCEVDELMSLGLHGDDSLAWNLKAWYGLLMPNRKRGFP